MFYGGVGVQGDKIIPLLRVMKRSQILLLWIVATALCSDKQTHPGAGRRGHAFDCIFLSHWVKLASSA